jgi:RNA polymerase subunit RPABC4/transcription elongation factor Spt4
MCEVSKDGMKIMLTQLAVPGVYGGKKFLLARVSVAPTTTIIKYAAGSFEKCTVYVTDECGASMPCTGTGGEIARMMVLRRGEVYKFTGIKVMSLTQKDRDFYMTVNCSNRIEWKGLQYELVAKKHIPKDMPYFFAPLTLDQAFDLLPVGTRVVCVCAVVSAIQPVKEVQIGAGNVQVQNIEVRDKKVIAPLAMWRKLPEMFLKTGAAVGQVIMITDVFFTKDAAGNAHVSTRGESTIELVNIMNHGGKDTSVKFRECQTRMDDVAKNVGDTEGTLRTDAFKGGGKRPTYDGKAEITTCQFIRGLTKYYGDGIERKLDGVLYEIAFAQIVEWPGLTRPLTDGESGPSYMACKKCQRKVEDGQCKKCGDAESIRQFLGRITIGDAYSELSVEIDDQAARSFLNMKTAAEVAVGLSAADKERVMSSWFVVRIRVQKDTYKDKIIQKATVGTAEKMEMANPDQCAMYIEALAEQGPGESAPWVRLDEVAVDALEQNRYTPTGSDGEGNVVQSFQFAGVV